MPSLTTREILENQFNGLTPIKRQNPRYGEKDYYYINPNRDRSSSLSDEDIAYVDSPDDPNPFLQQSSTTNPLSSSSSNEMGTDTTGLTGTNSLNNSSPWSTNTTSLKNDFSNPFNGVASAAVTGTVDGIYSTGNRWGDMTYNAPSRFSSLKDTAYDLVTNYNGYMETPQEYETQDPVSSQNSTLENATNYWKQYNTMKGLKMSDINKHQYMGCLAGKDGVTFGLTGLAAGAGKEVKDMIVKWIDEEQKKKYGGWSGIWADSVKDMNNNIKGFYHGYVENEPCYPLLNNSLP